MDKQGPNFEFYTVVWGTWNSYAPTMYNIFNNVKLYKAVLREVKRYVRSPKKYTFKPFYPDQEALVGFEALCQCIDRLIAWEESSRFEYEIMVNGLLDDPKTATKIDCYYQAHPNTAVIARDCVYKYKEWKKTQTKGG